MPIAAVFCESRKQFTVACSPPVFYLTFFVLCHPVQLLICFWLHDSAEVSARALQNEGKKNKALFESTKNGHGRPVYKNNLA